MVDRAIISTTTVSKFTVWVNIKYGTTARKIAGIYPVTAAESAPFA
jgi:hypothetical protein